MASLTINYQLNFVRRLGIYRVGGENARSEDSGRIGGFLKFSQLLLFLYFFLFYILFSSLLSLFS
jgi:hypothetical protein